MRTFRNCLETLYSKDSRSRTIAAISWLKARMLALKAWIFSSIAFRMESIFLTLSLTMVLFCWMSSRRAVRRLRPLLSISFSSMNCFMLSSLKKERLTALWSISSTSFSSFLRRVVMRVELILLLSSHSMIAFLLLFWRMLTSSCLTARQPSNWPIFASMTDSLGLPRRASRLQMSSSTPEWQFWICSNSCELMPFASCCSVNYQTKLMV